VSGDLDLSAVGTVTWSGAGQVLCFGHPLFGAGSVSLPLTTAYVHTVLASEFNSVKLASAGEVVGALLEDRAFGVRGTLGAAAAQLPLRLDVTDAAGQVHRLRYGLMRHHSLTPILASLAVSDGLGSQAGNIARLAVPYRATVYLAGGRTVEWQDQPASAAGTAALEPARELGSRLRLLLDNSWREAQVDSVRLVAAVRPGSFGAVLESAWLLSGSARPGQRLAVALRLRPELGQSYVEQLELQLPEFLPAGSYRLVVGDADALVEAERSRAPGVFRPATLEQALRVLELRQTHAAVYAALYSEDIGASTGGTELPALPGGALSALQDGRLQGGLQWVRARRWALASKPLPCTLAGSQELNVDVESVESEGR
ncbi:MAG TPA: hypothetical protein VMS93_03620, partial [Candidatus Saccharimonadales bacterium]|nr:hypothetical protein [Candidatus Saccharimonadales bacterium]